MIAACTCIVHVSMAAEIDSVTPRRVVLDDALDDINAIINERIREGVADANADRLQIENIEGIEIVTQHADCDEDDLYTELRKSVFQSFTASWGLKGYDLDLQLRQLLSDKVYSLALRDSIYRDINYLEGFSLNLKELSSVANIGGYLVGLDKLGHFFAEGWRYFEISLDEDAGLQDAMAWGRDKEAGMFGTSTTGVFSYADLVANFNGMRFWNRILLKQRDPLNGWFSHLVDGPYISCDIQVLESIKQLEIVRAWQVSREFDLADYADAAWDEAINCNSYADPFIEEKVKLRIAEVDPEFICPMSKGACIAAREKYGKFARQLLHPYCLIAQ
jgi:hypothetical protein